MYGKIFAIAVIVLGVYLIANVFIDKSSKEENTKGAELYHIGCYDIDRPLSHSKDILLYLSQLSQQFNQTSPGRIAALNKKV